MASPPVPATESMDVAGDQPPSLAVRAEVGMMSLSRAQSLPVAVESRSTRTPTRATFPFKPASALILHQETSKDDGSHAYALPATFRPRPVVPVLSLQHPRRCASFPIDTPGNYCKTQQRRPPAPPDWLYHYVRNRSLPPFPISIDSTKDGDCWWLREMSRIVRRKPTKVQVDEDGGIELVDSEDEDEIDVIDEGLVKRPSSSDGSDEDVGVAVEDPIQTIDTRGEYLATLDDAAKAVTSSQKRQNRSLQQTLQTKIEELRAEMERSAKDMSAEKRTKMEKLFHQVEGAIQTTTEGDAGVSNTTTHSNDVPAPNTIDHIRRTAVAITGGTLTAAGVVLIPCPIIPGCVVVYGGLLVLATEFDSAKKALDILKEPLVRWLADDEEGNAKAPEEHNPHRWEELMGCTTGNTQRQRALDEDFATIMSKKPDLETEDSGAEKAKSPNPIKPILRKLLMLDSQGDARSGAEDTKHSSQSAPIAETVSPSCHSDLSGCSPLFSFDYDDFDTKEDTATEGATYRPSREVEILNRLCSDGSITLNTLNHDDEHIRLFSRQDTANSSYGNDDECLWGCNAHALLSSDGCQTDSIAEEKKR